MKRYLTILSLLIFSVTNNYGQLFTNEVKIIETDGKVGIGSTNPSTSLHLSSGNTGDGIIRIEADTDNNSEDDNPKIEFAQDGGILASAFGHGLGIGELNQNSLYFANSISSGGIGFAVGTTNGYTNATTAMFINPNGNIGIRTLNPYGTIQIEVPDRTMGDPGSIIFSNSGLELRSGVNSTNNYAWMEVTERGITNNRDLVLQGLGGNIGIGTNNPPSEKLQVIGTVYSNGYKITANNGYGIRFWNGSSAYMMNMSQAGDANFGGRVAGETTSDYNMYFKMEGGTNRGFVFKDANTSGIFSINPNGIYSREDIKAPAFVQSSDIRLKNIFGTILGLDILKKYQDLNLYSFGFKNEDQKHIGVVAQEVEKVFPELVKTDNEGIKSVDYPTLAVTAIAAIKEQQEEIENNQNKIKNMEEYIRTLTERIEKLENR